MLNCINLLKCFINQQNYNVCIDRLSPFLHCLQFQVKRQRVNHEVINLTISYWNTLFSINT